MASEKALRGSSFSLKASCLGVALVLAMAAWSAFDLRFQADPYLLYPQNLKSLERLREYHRTSASSKTSVVVLDVPGSGWAPDAEDAFWKALTAILEKTPGIVAVERGTQNPGEMASMLASCVASLPPDRFEAVVRRLQPEAASAALKDIPSRLTGALDAEELTRLRMDPLGLLTDVELPAKDSSALGTPPLLKVRVVKELEGFQEFHEWEIFLDGAVEKALAEIERSEDRDCVYLTGDPILTSQISRLMERDMSAPSKTNASQLDNPTRVTANPRHGTEPYA
jgi:hypothetical protein